MQFLCEINYQILSQLTIEGTPVLFFAKIAQSPCSMIKIHLEMLITRQVIIITHAHDQCMQIMFSSKRTTLEK